MLTELLKDYTKIEEGNVIPTFIRTSDDKTRQVWVRPLESPGEWFIYFEDYKTGAIGNTSQEKDLCYISLMDAFHSANSFLKGATDVVIEHKR